MISHLERLHNGHGNNIECDNDLVDGILQNLRSADTLLRRLLASTPKPNDLPSNSPNCTDVEEPLLLSSLGQESSESQESLNTETIPI